MLIKQHLTTEETNRGVPRIMKEFARKGELRDVPFVKNFVTGDFKRFTTKETDGKGLLLMAEYNGKDDRIVGLVTPYDDALEMGFPRWEPVAKRSALASLAGAGLAMRLADVASSEGSDVPVGPLERPLERPLEIAPGVPARAKGKRKYTPGPRSLEKREDKVWKVRRMMKLDTSLSETGACKLAGISQPTFKKWNPQIRIEPGKEEVVAPRGPTLEEQLAAKDVEIRTLMESKDVEIQGLMNRNKMLADFILSKYPAGELTVLSTLLGERHAET